jgi:hypothetical protein
VWEFKVYYLSNKYDIMKTLQNYITDSLSIDEASLLDIEGSIKEGDAIITQFEHLKTAILNKKSYFTRCTDSYILEIEHVDKLFDCFNVNYKHHAAIFVDIRKYDVDMNIYDYEWNLIFNFYSDDKCVKTIEKVFYTKQMMFSKFLETKIEPMFKDFKTFEKLVKDN